MRKFLILLLSTYLALIFLMPKVNLYYTLKQQLQREHVTMTQERLQDRWFDLKIEGMKLYYDGIESADAERVEVLAWLLFNRIEAEGVRAGKDLRKLFDFRADRVVVIHSVIHPTEAALHAEGNFGTVSGKLNLKSGKIHLTIEPSARFRQSAAFRELFRKSGEGYIYESTLY